MSREIYTYTDLTKLNESNLYQSIKYYPQVTVSTDLRKGLSGTEKIDQVDGLFSGDNKILITEFHSLEQAMNEKWRDDQSKFYEMIILSEYIRQEIEKAGENKKKINWLIGCKRNIDSILSSIIMLEQADIRPEDIDTGSDRNIEFLVGAWKYLIDRDSLITSYRESMSKSFSKSDWNPILRTAFKTEESFIDVDTIVFHGFYYITPIQEKIMGLLEEAGYRLIFLFQYDEKYPFVYEIWDETYSEDRGYPSKKYWHMEKSDKPDVYGDIFEGRKNVSINNNLQIREYASVMEFVNDIKHIRDKGDAIYSSNHKSANKILKDFFPEEYGERKILSYPVGLFVSTLNQMWDSDLKTVILNEESLIDCFSSGWLTYNGISGRRYLKDLIYILPFFTGCQTYSDWIKKIEYLKTIRNDAIEPFLVDLDADESISRWQEAIGNPLANFSMFAVDSDKLDVILALIEQLLNMANDLFDDDKLIRVADHIYKLEHILQRHKVSDEMYDQEKKIVADIFEKLNKPSDFEKKCYPADIANAISLFIYNKFEEGEIQTNKVGLIYPLFFVDAACIKNKSKVHICMCDVNSMPGGNKEYVWPLSSPIMKKCFERTHNPLIINLMQIMESTVLCNRYFMYAALKNKDVTLSWISEVNDKLLAPSPYIKLLCDATGIKSNETKYERITFSRVAESSYGLGKVEEYDNEKTPSGIIKEAQMAYALCPMKYTLGYILEKFPTYQSEFQQNYALNAFISAMYSLMKDKGMTVEQVYKNVITLFPGLRNVEKRQVYDYISYDRRENDMDYTHRTECGGYFYTDERLKIHYPNQQVREVAIDRYGKLMTPDRRKGMNLYEVMEATNDEEMYGKKDVVKMACMFCPHIDYCRNAVYFGDQENLYD